MMTLITVISEESDPVLQFEQTHFQAKFVITTADYIGRQQRVDARHRSYTDPEVAPVSGNILSKRIRGMLRLCSSFKAQYLPTTSRNRIRFRSFL